jgi:hypothetical protein
MRKSPRRFNYEALFSASLSAAFVLLGGCESTRSNDPATATLLQNEHPIDGLNRNVSESQGGAIQDPYSIYPPPIRRDYTNDR